MRLFFSKQHDRTTTINRNILYSVIFRGGSVLISLILVPVTINYVNTTQYGIWLTLSSLITWFYFFDLGLGNGLKNKLAESNALNENKNSKIFVSTTYAIISIISLIIFIALFTANYFINWNKILNIYSIDGKVLSNIALIFFLFFCAQFVIQLINTVLTACHAPAIVSLITFISQAFSLLFICVLKLFTMGSLINLVLILAGTPLVVQLVASFIFYNSTYKPIAPNIKYIRFKQSSGLLTLGSVFFVIQVGQLILYQTDNIVITQIFGPNQVTTFNISLKYFSVITIFFTILINPYWSAFTDAYLKKDFSWIKAAFNKMQQYWLVAFLLALIMVIVSPYVIKLWLGNKVRVPGLLSITMAVSVVVSALHMLCCYFLNGINKIKIQLYLYIFCILVNIPIAIFLCKKIGIIGVTVSNIIVFVIMSLILYVQCKKIINNTARGLWNL